MKTKPYILNTISFLLLLLWIPSALDKVVYFESFGNDILRQPFGDAFAKEVIYTLPGLELLAVCLLVSQKYRWVGYGLSSVLMAAFTIYVAMAWMGAWAKLPCGCGKLISWMTWQQHFWFNLFFLALSIVGFALQYKARDGIRAEARNKAKVKSEKAKGKRLAFKVLDWSIRLYESTTLRIYNIKNIFPAAHRILMARLSGEGRVGQKTFRTIQAAASRHRTEKGHGTD